MISWPMLSLDCYNNHDPLARRIAITFKAENQHRKRNREDFRAKAKLHWALTKYEPRNEKPLL